MISVTPTMQEPNMPHDSQGPAQSSFQTKMTSFGGRTSLVVVAIGLVIIGLGYNGIAGASVNGLVDVRAQLPYLISGGVFGLALVIVGAALMITQNARADRVRLEAKLDELIAAQGHVAGTAVPPTVDGLYVAGTASYHVPGCRLVDGREETSYVTVAEAEAADLKPCRVCQPQAATNVSVR